MPYRPSQFDPTQIHSDSPLILKQQLYTYLVGVWLTWIYSELTGVRVTMSEQYVAITDGKDGDHDGPHRADGAHYSKRGGDWDLFINCTFEHPQGEYVSDGGHPMWKVIGDKWAGLHSLARWGGHFASRDDNHISIEHAGTM